MMLEPCHVMGAGGARLAGAVRAVSLQPEVADRSSQVD